MDVQLDPSALLQNNILSSSTQNYIIFPIVQNNMLSSSVQSASPSSGVSTHIVNQLVSSVQNNFLYSSIKTASPSSTNNVNQSSVSSGNSLRIQPSPHWLVNPLFPRLVPLLQHISSFTKEDDIDRNGLVEGHLLDNNDAFLPLIGIVALECSDWLP